ncbi:hypothetical protein NY78_1545 [Desulfovibrio sp. TomC]|nr:hypothetical protein NY78_1545 [Desulfovibrio sp. TomC]
MGHAIPPLSRRIAAGGAFSGPFQPAWQPGVPPPWLRLQNRLGWACSGIFGKRPGCPAQHTIMTENIVAAR